MSLAESVGTWLGARYFRPMPEQQFREQRAKILQQTPIPVFWLFGKTGSGKTSIIKYLTGAEQAQIGTGYRPQTRTSFRYDFPSHENMILQFLDTRGLGEIHYDPSEDIEQFDKATHLIVVTARVMDHAMEPVVEPLRKIRRASPHRPVLLALTCLHDAYPQRQHPLPDPFEGSDDPENIPEDLKRSIAEQKRRFAGLFDAVVPIDLTKPEEGFNEANFGGDRLKAKLADMLPSAYRQTFLTLESVMGSLRDLHEKRATPYILSASMAAATAAAFPLPWLDIPAVAGIQTDMVRRLAGLYGQQFNVPRFFEIAGAVGGRLVVRQVVREVLKVIPGVGQAANAAVSFAYTFSLGKACCWYFGEIMAGHAPTREELQNTMKEQFKVAQAAWRTKQQAAQRPAEAAS